MKLPRDVDGRKLASLLSRYGYEVTRQTCSHIRLTLLTKGNDHHVTVPAQKTLKVGTLGGILTEVADYLKIGRAELMRDLFGF